VAEAVRWLARWPAQRRGAIVGDMLELGPDEVAWHRRLAEMADWSSLDVVATVGPRMEALAEELRSRGVRPEVLHFATVEDVFPWFARAWRAGDVWLLKASHAMGFERFVEWPARSSKPRKTRMLYLLFEFLRPWWTPCGCFAT
jgi:UDP-N-acetylmuramyl pentapeptide synthase